MMTSARRLTSVAAAALSLLVLPAAATAQTLVTSFGSAPGPTNTLPIPTSPYTFHNSYTFADGTQFASSANSSIGSGGYGLCSNGGWNQPQVGLDASSGSMRFMFNAPVSWVAAFMNYAEGCGGGDVFVRALGAGNNVLSSFNVSTGSPISTPSGTNAGAVRGISHSNADIYGFELSNQYVIVGELQYAAVVATPEPASLVLLGTGLLGVVGFARRRRTA